MEAVKAIILTSQNKTVLKLTLNLKNDDNFYPPSPNLILLCLTGNHSNVLLFGFVCTIYTIVCVFYFM